MAARRALEWIGMSKGRLVFRYEISDLLHWVYARNCVRIESSNVCKSNVNFCSGLLGPQKRWIKRPCGLFELQASHTENIIISQWWLEPIDQVHAAWWFGFAHLSMSYTDDRRKSKACSTPMYMYGHSSSLFGSPSSCIIILVLCSRYKTTIMFTIMRRVYNVIVC